MKTPKAQQARSLSAAIRTAGQNLMVLVGKEYAPYFKAVPKDGNTYIVQDPLVSGRAPHDDVRRWQLYAAGR